ncbi:MAG: hypothetical protein WA906_14055, partial [Pacificimonas sp.]
IASIEPDIVLSMRGGSLLVETSHRHLGIAPVIVGQRLLREMVRVETIAEKERSGRDLSTAGLDAAWTDGKVQYLGGQAVSPEAAEWLRTVTLSRQPEAIEVNQHRMPPLWRQADPKSVPHIVEALAVKLAERLS